MTQDEMVGQHHILNGQEFEQSLGDGDGRGSVVCCISWGHKVVRHDLVTEQQLIAFKRTQLLLKDQPCLWPHSTGTV